MNDLRENFKDESEEKQNVPVFRDFLKRFNSNLSADRIMKWWCSKNLGDQEHIFPEYT